MNTHKTLLAAAVVFALAACQPEPGGSFANAASEGDPLLVHEDDEDRDEDHDDHHDGDHHDHDGDPGDEEGDRDDRDDTNAVASSPAQATEHADPAADDALLDTRQGGNPLVDPAIAPVEPIAQEGDEPEDDEDR